jgi:hypothetical protein
MHFIRRHGWLAACPALAAILLQIALSLGHFHPIGGSDEHGPGPFLTDRGDSRAPDGDGGTDRHGDADYCAICAMSALLGGGQIALAPELPANSANLVLAKLFAAEQIGTEPRTSGFRSRAPPLS